MKNTDKRYWKTNLDGIINHFEVITHINDTVK